MLPSNTFTILQIFFWETKKQSIRIFQKLSYLSFRLHIHPLSIFTGHLFYTRPSVRPWGHRRKQKRHCLCHSESWPLSEWSGHCINEVRMVSGDSEVGSSPDWSGAAALVLCLSQVLWERGFNCNLQTVWKTAQWGGSQRLCQEAVGGVPGGRRSTCKDLEAQRRMEWGSVSPAWVSRGSGRSPEREAGSKQERPHLSGKEAGLLHLGMLGDQGGGFGSEAWSGIGEA